MPDGQVLYGKTLLDMANNDYTDPRTLVEAKQLDAHLDSSSSGGQAFAVAPDFCGADGVVMMRQEPR